MGDVRIIVVCTANICRSPSTAALLRQGLVDLLPEATVTSAGVAAVPDRPVCDLSAALAGSAVERLGVGGAARTADALAQHRSHDLAQADLQAADLVLGLDRSHRSEIARMHPAIRPKTFTLRQAAAAADLISDAFHAGHEPEGSPGVPEGAVERFSWWVDELDAARPLVVSGGRQTWEKLSFDPHDVPDPHVCGYEYHPLAAELIGSAVKSIIASLRLLMEFGVGAGSLTLAERHGEAP